MRSEARRRQQLRERYIRVRILLYVCPHRRGGETAGTSEERGGGSSDVSKMELLQCLFKSRSSYVLKQALTVERGAGSSDVADGARGHVSEQAPELRQVGA